MEENINVTQPNSVGALLAEEWTMDPSSPLPSFLEMMLVDEASRSTLEALETVIEVATRWLSSLGDIQISGLPSLSAPLVDALQARTRGILQKVSRFSIAYKLELQFLVWYLLQRHSLHSSVSATTSEALYGMRRSKLQPFIDSDGKTISTRRKLVDLSGADRTRVALLTALIPYVCRKTYQMAHRLSLQPTTPAGDSNGLAQLLASSSLPLSTTLSSIKLICQWLYLNGRSLFFDPTSLLLNHVVRRVAQADMKSTAPLSKNEQLSEPIKSASDFPYSLVYMLSVSVVFSWITQIRADFDNHRRRQYTSLSSRGMNRASNVPPPPPITRPKHEVPGESCPICLGDRVSPAASSAGYVFCDTCIRDYVQRFRKCPVSGKSCPASGIVRLFEPRSDAS